METTTHPTGISRPPTTTPRTAVVLMAEAHSAWRAKLTDDVTYTVEIIRLRKIIAAAR